ncbi:MAG TPA: sulfite exporter TauE/SafE family protein [Ferruginibacter sp.]|nr:sulfite exporter TauE/SafE family protein [Ferruginibacter sp.]HMP20747.1 sulfite exporter TauE/SafE family protein [Ferruginibacter sp.]
MEYIGYFFAILIGVSLGLIGGGGSILTVPVLVYIFHLDAAAATVYSLFIVGLTSAVGSVNYLKRGLVHLRAAMVFGIPSVAGVFIARLLIVPNIPEHIFSIGQFVVTRHILLMLLFAVLMVGASYNMIKKQKAAPAFNKELCCKNYVMTILQGLLIGIITGMVGAGGGFMIIPALLFVLHLPMKKAIGTSLLIIALNSLLGFAGSVGHVAVQWPFILTIAAFAIAGIFIGNRLSKKIDGAKLKPIFGWFVLIMGVYIILKETVFK